MAFIQRSAKQRIILFLLFLLSGSFAFSQTTLNVASGSAVQGGSVPLNVSLTASISPAALQWTVSYAPGDVASVSIAAGAALTAAGKTITCNAISGSTTCVAAGMNANTIGNGAVAVVTVTLASSTSSSSVPVSIGNAVGVLADGTAAAVSGTAGAITVQGWQPPPVTVTGLSCAATSITTPGSTTCTVTLSTAAASTLSIGLADTNTAVASAPTTVPVLSGASTATFTVSGASVSSLQTATLTASLNGSSAATTLTFLPAGAVTGTIAAYAFDEGSGTTTADASGNGITGQLQGATWIAAGKYGNALSFNGSTGYVNLGTPASLQTTGSMTWSAWVNATGNPPDDGQIVSLGDSFSGWQLKTTPDTGPRTFGIGISPNGTSHTQRYSKTVLSLNTWYHVAGVYNAATQALDIYVNGVLDDGTLKGVVPSSQVVPALSATIGKRSDGYYFNGVIDNLRIYNRALSAAEIQADMSTPVGGAASNPVPAITSLSPVSVNAGVPAFTLTVNGTGFVSGSVVNWNGAGRTTTFVSATQLQASITASDVLLALTAQVTVVNPAPGGGTSANSPFTIISLNPAPNITSMSPSTAMAGTAAFTLTVNGTGMLNGSVVKWNGSNRTTAFMSATQLQAAITAADIAAAGAAPVTVFNPAPGGGTSANSTFTINAANPVPTITSLSPASATAGTAAFTLTVNGTGFLSGSVVKWNGANRTTTFMSATQLQASITAADITASGTAQTTVFNPAPGGGTSANSPFTINAANPVPTITSLSPASATAGTAAFTLTVNGTGFLSGSVVNWNGSNRTTTFISATQLQAAITAADIAAAATAQATVFNPAPGGGTSANSPFTINASNPVPTITSLSPASATAGTAAFTLTVNGTGFLSSSVVKWNGSNRTTTFVSATQLQAAITAADIAAAATAQATVFNPAPGGGTSANSPFTINAANPVPAITSLSPASATAGTAAFTLTVNGTGFLSGSVVKWNGANRTTTFVSATQLQAAITAADIAAAATAQATVFNPAPGGGTSANSPFTINASNPMPTITSLSPASAMAGTAAFTLTVNGTGFLSGSVVKWNGANRTTTFMSATQLQASITAADITASGTAQGTVFNPTPGGGTSANSPFTINAANPVPAITSLSPTSATAGTAAFTLTVNGTGFLSGSVVKWNGANRTTTFVSATQLQAAITAADIAAAATAQATVFNPAPGGGTSANSLFTITAAVVISSLNCSPASLASGAISSCTATISKAAPSSGSLITLSSNNTALTVPTSVTVTGGGSSASFNATANSVSTQQVVTLTGSMPGSSTTATVTVQAAQTATGPAAAYGFSEGAGTTTSDASGNGITGQMQGATWTTAGKYGNAVAFNGSNSYIDLGNPSSLQITGSMTWSAWAYATGNLPDDGQIVARSDDYSGWQLKTSADTGNRTFAVAVSPNGTSHTQRYSKTVLSLNTWYHVAGVYNAAAKTLDIYVNGVLDDGTLKGAVSSSQFLPNLNTTIGKRSGGLYFKGTIDELRIYTRALSQAEIQTDMNTPIGASTTQVLTTSATPEMVTNSESQASISPALNSTATTPAVRNAVSALSCSPRSVKAGGQVTCELRMTISPVPLQFQLTSSSTQVKIPAAIVSRPNQPGLTFQAAIEPTAKQQSAVVTAVLGDSQAQDTIIVTPAAQPILTAPAKRTAKLGNPLTFNVTALDPMDLPLQLAATGIPAGASFDSASGRFEWTPSASQTGTYHVAFTATNSAGQWSTAQVMIGVDSGMPVLTPSERFACSPGSVATLAGRWLAAPNAVLSDPSGSSMDLGGTKVKVNGQYASVLFGSEAAVSFLCPAIEPGAQLSVAVETASAISNTLTTTMQEASPMILSLDSSGENQGLVSFVGSTDIVMDRNFSVPAHPAQPGDQVLIWTTGLGSAASATPSMSVKLGDVYAEVDSAQAVPGYAGLYALRVRIPDTTFGNAVTVQLEVATPDAHTFNSNSVTIAVEPVNQ
jgi:hypothetical protein